MGYYSEVGLCLNKAAHAAMLKKLAKQNKETKKEVKELLTYADKYIAHAKTEKESVLYHWEWVKWYSSYTEVKFIEEFLQTLGDDEEVELLYRFVRIGEDYDDIEFLGGYYDNPFEMDLGRSVYINSQFSPILKPQNS